jgi:hypothetical protein
LLAALLLVLVVGGAAFAVDKARDGNEQRDAADATRAAQLAVLDSSPAATATTEAESAVSPTTESDDGAVAPEATATPKPTREPATESADKATPTKRTATKEPTPRPSSLRAPDFLPDLNDVPDGFVVTGDGRLSKDEVIGSIGENGADLLVEWEWRENAFRYFEIPQDAAPDPESASSLTVSVHRFRNRDGATDALSGLAEIVAAADYEEVKIDKIGDQTEALKSETADGNYFVVYVRSANFVIRLGGYSASGDASEAVIDLAKTIVEG